MTNGEKLKEVFPDIQIFNVTENEQREKFINIRLGDVCQAIELEWWNAEYKEPKTGHWINIDATHSQCDKCGAVFEIISANGETNYCPCCGAKMD